MKVFKNRFRYLTAVKAALISLTTLTAVVVAVVLVKRRMS
jgi:hypothetical protein